MRRLDAGQIEVVDADMARVFRAKTGGQRLRIASGMFSSARRMIRSMLVAQHPDWSQRRIDAEAARRLSHGAG